MIGIKTKLNPAQLAAIKAKLTKLRGVLERASQVDEKIEQGIKEEINAIFDTEGSAGGSSWPRLAPMTIRLRTSRGTWPGKILQEFGELRGGIHVKSDGAKVKIEVDAPYASIHHEGTRKVPQRRFLPRDERLLALTKGPVQEFIRAVINDLR